MPLLRYPPWVRSQNWISSPPLPASPRAKLRRGDSALGSGGTHTSRTIMLQDMAHLLAATRVSATRDDYVRAVIEDNCLGKRTAASRRLSTQRLTEIYGLDRRLMLFRVLRGTVGTARE